jgi:hypothetical protein
LSETLASAAIKAVEARPARRARQCYAGSSTGRCALEPDTVLCRCWYRPWRRGPFSRRAGIPLVESPVGIANLIYDETRITLTWPGSAAPSADPGSTSYLPSRPFGPAVPTVAYNVYELKRAEDEENSAPVSTRLNKDPLETARFEDTRVEWDVERCYVVRVVRTVSAMTVESEASPPVCRTIKDTFPPKPPTGLQHIASAGAVNLTWDQNSEKDLAGYLVLRGTDLAGRLEPLTPSPIPNSSYTDIVPPGAHFVYAIQAVDRAGNASQESPRIEETAR